MLKLRMSVAACALSLALAPPAMSQSLDDVLATVGDSTITLGHVIAVTMQLPQDAQEIEDERLFGLIMEQLIQQAALAEGVAVSKSVALILDNESRAMRAAQAIDAQSAESVTDADIQALYDVQFAGFEPTPEFNASHILVETEEEATALIADLEGGADFATLAKEKSTGPSGPSGGELGWFGPGQMVPTFDEAVQNMSTGEVAGPVETQFGWHVIKLNDTRQTDAPALSDVRDQLENTLRQTAVRDAIDAAVEAAEIDKSGMEGVDPSLIRRTDLLGD